MAVNNDIIAYKFDVSLKYREKKNSVPISINPEFIRYIVIERKFTTRVMPVIFVSLNVELPLFNKIYEAQSNKINKKEKTESNFLLRIRRFNKLARAALYETTIDDEFDYIVSKETKQTERTDGKFKTFTVALISHSLLNGSKAERDKNNSILVSGVFSKIDTNTLIAKVFEGIEKYNIKNIIKPPVHNTEYKDQSLVIPPMSSRKKILEYIFDKAPFYDTGFIFFIDYGRAYLLDKSKDGIEVNDGTCHDVIFDIRGELSDFSYVEGISIKKNSYIVYVSVDKCIVQDNLSQDKVANTIITVSDSGELDAVTINNNSSLNSDPKYVFKRGINAKLYKNNIDSDTVSITITKENLDGSAFTPNKRYRIRDYAHTNHKYNGYYFLTYEKELIINDAGDFSGSVQFGLQKVGDIDDIGDTDGDTGEVVYRDNSTGSSNVDEVMSNTYLSASSDSTYTTRHSVSGSDTTKAINATEYKDPSTMISVNNNPTTEKSGSSLGSDSIKKFENGTLKGEPLKNDAVPLGSPAKLSVEEEIRLAEQNRTPRLHGNEVNHDSSGPVKRFKYNENIRTKKFIDA